MDIENYLALLNLVVRVVTIAVFALFLIPRQIREVTRPKNGFTGLRWRLLVSLLLMTAMLIVTLPRLVQVAQTPSVGLSADVATISMTVFFIAFVINEVSIYTYKEKK